MYGLGFARGCSGLPHRAVEARPARRHAGKTAEKAAAAETGRAARRAQRPSARACAPDVRGHRKPTQVLLDLAQAELGLRRGLGRSHASRPLCLMRKRNRPSWTILWTDPLACLRQPLVHLELLVKWGETTKPKPPYDTRIGRRAWPHGRRGTRAARPARPLVPQD